MASDGPSQENRLIQVSITLKGDDPKKKRFLDEKLLLESFTGQEGISMPFHFDLVLRSLDPAIRFDDVINRPATIKMLLPDAKVRFIDGIISTFTELDQTLFTPPGQAQPQAINLTCYQATLVPKLWILTRNHDCRIFQNRTVPSIIKAILKENGVDFIDDRMNNPPQTPNPYQPREYCVQYSETDFDFISRLMEEEGIFYFFIHEDGKHTLVLADDPSQFKQNPLEPKAVYRPGADPKTALEAVTAWNVVEEVRPDKYELRDFNFKDPRVDLSVRTQTGDDASLEIYDFPGEYEDVDRGVHLVGTRMEEIESSKTVINGASRCQGLLPGFFFTLDEHFRPDFNKRRYVPTSIFHVAKQGSNFRSSIFDGSCDFVYTNTFTCIPFSTLVNGQEVLARFRSPRTTQLPIISSVQTAIVVGSKDKPKDQEILTDKFGRVKVRFHWDRRKQNQPNPDDDPLGDCPGDCSCFVRVAQPWTGTGWGHQWIPRIGQEVVVTFLEGNPDRPLITGMVYNGINPPPFSPVDHPTQSGIKTRSTPKGTKDNFNVIRFEDKKGHEQLWIHAENAMLESVEGSQTITVGGNRSITTGGVDKDGNKHGDVKELVFGNHNLHVKSDDRIKIEGDSHLHVQGKADATYDSDLTLKAGGKCVILADQIQLQGTTKVVLMAGSSSIVIDASGVTVLGSPLINLNSPGAPPAPEIDPLIVDPEDP